MSKSKKNKQKQTDAAAPRNGAPAMAHATAPPADPVPAAPPAAKRGDSSIVIVGLVALAIVGVMGFSWRSDRHHLLERVETQRHGVAAQATINERLREQASSASAAMSRYETERDRLASELATAAKVREKAESEIKTQTAALADLRTRIDLAESERAASARTQKQAAAVAGEREAKLLARIQELETSFANEVAMQRDAQRRTDDLLARAGTLEQELAHARAGEAAQRDQARKRAYELTARSLELERRLSVEVESRASITEKQLTLAAQAEGLTASLDQARRSESTLRDELAGASRAKVELESRLRKLSDELVATRTRTDGMERDAKRREIELARAVDQGLDLNERLRRAQGSLDAKESQHVSLARELEAVRGTLAGTKAEARKTDERAVALETTVQQMERELAELREALRQSDQGRTAAVAESTRIAGKLTTESRLREALRQENETRVKELEEARARAKALEEEIDSLQARVQQATTRVRSAAAELVHAKEETAALFTEGRDLRSQRERSTVELADTRADLADVRVQLETARVAASDATRARRAAEAANRDQAARLDSMEKDTAALRRMLGEQERRERETGAGLQRLRDEHASLERRHNLVLQENRVLLDQRRSLEGRLERALEALNELRRKLGGG